MKELFLRSIFIMMKLLRGNEMFMALWNSGT